MNDSSNPVDVLGELDRPATAADLADRAAYSRPQFHRIARRALGQAPMTVRRRILLERAAYRLTRTRRSVTEIAFDAGYESLEGFSRAFRSAFGVAPRRFRTLRAEEFRFDLRERWHYAPVEESERPGEPPMNALELLNEHHAWEMDRFVAAAARLTDAQLDAPIPHTYEPYPWCPPQVTLRQALGRAVAFAAPWMEAILGEKTDYEPASLDDLRAAIEVNRLGFAEILTSVERDRAWDVTFVDSGCEPPQVFSYAGVVAHALTHAAYRRMAISQRLRELLPDVDRVRDPIDCPRR